MKLTADNIKFIDSYLVNSGVKYIDIRMEMVDHIATALEQTEGMFYDNFRKYMAEHKMQLLKANRNFAYAALKSALRQMGLQMLGPWFLIPLALMLIVLYFSKLTIIDSLNIAEGVYSTAVVAFAMYFVYRRFIKKFPYSVADSIICSATLFNYISNRMINFRGLDDTYRLAGYIFCTAFAIAAFRVYIKIISGYKQKYYA